MDIYPKIEAGLAGLEIGVLGILHICNLDDSGETILSYLVLSRTRCSGLKERNFFFSFFLNELSLQ